MSDFLKDGMGWNFVPVALGEKINSIIVSLVQNGEIKPAIGRVIDFEDIPQTLQDLGDRKTVGKIVAIF